MTGERERERERMVVHLLFLSQECAVIWNKTIPLFVVTSLCCWICVFINLLIPWLAGKTISRQYGSFSILLEHLLYIVDKCMVDKVNYHCSTKWINVRFFFSPLLSLKVKMISGSLLAMSGKAECYTFSSCFLACQCYNEISQTLM